MASKAMVLAVFLLAALLISSQVLARDLADHTSTSKESGVNEAAGDQYGHGYHGGYGRGHYGGGGGYGRGYRGGYGHGGGYRGGYGHGGGGRRRCCGKNGEMLDDNTEVKPQN